MSHGSPDYLIDIVCDGLIRKHGRSSVSLDYTNIDTSGGWCGQYQMAMQGFRAKETFHIDDADVLVASTRSLKGVDEWMRRTGKSKVALLDGEDGCDIFEPWPSRVKVYFKREYITGRAYLSNILPLQFGMIPESAPKAGTSFEVSRDVFFRAHPNHHDRNAISKALESMGYKVSQERMKKDEYNKHLMESLIGISVRGGGWDTYRYWETAYFGAALLSQRLAISIPNNFKENVEAVFFSGEKDMVRKLKKMIEEKQRTAALASRGRKACLERHMSVNRASTVLEALM